MYVYLCMYWYTPHLVVSVNQIGEMVVYCEVCQRMVTIQIYQKFIGIILRNKRGYGTDNRQCTTSKQEYCFY